jgi:hypothetical protein
MQDRMLAMRFQRRVYRGTRRLARQTGGYVVANVGDPPARRAGTEGEAAAEMSPGMDRAHVGALHDNGRLGTHN